MIFKTAEACVRHKLSPVKLASELNQDGMHVMGVFAGVCLLDLSQGPLTLKFDRTTQPFLKFDR